MFPRKTRSYFCSLLSAYIKFSDRYVANIIRANLNSESIYDVLKFVLENLETEGIDSLFSLIVAAKRVPLEKKIRLLHLLFDKGANINACNQDGQTLIQQAESSKQYELAYFLKKKAHGVESEPKTQKR